MPIESVPIVQNGNTYNILTKDINNAGTYAQLIMLAFDNGADGYTLASAANGLPVVCALPTGAATSAKQDAAAAILSSIDGKISSDPSTGTKQDTGNTTLSQINGKVGPNKTTSAETLVSATATSAPLFSANANRKSLVIQNRGGSRALLRFSSGTATYTGVGLYLDPMQSYEPYDVPTGAATCICDTGNTTTLYVREGT
jgi:hypothetical protein